MANIKIPKSEIKKYLKLDGEELVDRINLMGTPVEGVSGEEIEVQIMPNRPDALSVQGFLRILKAYSGKEGMPKYKVHSPDKDFVVKISPSVKDVRPYTACAIVKNLHFDDSKIKEIIDLQEKLHTTVGRNRKKLAIGIYPLEKITLPITYEARKPGEIKFRPLEANEEMSGAQILQRHPAGREYAKLLEGCSTYPVFVDAKGKILSMPPIINSHETGKITETTKDVFIECSGFDFNTLKKTLNIVVTTLADMGGKIYAMELHYAKKEITPDLKPEKMRVSLENANKLLGLQLKEKDLEKLLPKMGYEYAKGKVSVPAWRTDILHEVDLIEDIAIAYGYDNLVPEIPKVATIGEESRESKIKSKIAEILVGLGLIETSSYHLVKSEEIQRTHIAEEDRIELQDSKTEYKFLRPDLLTPTLRILAENKDNEYPQRIFELGTTFQKDKANSTESGIKESENLIVALTPGKFTEIKQILDYLAKMLSLEFKLKDSPSPEMIEGRTGKILLNNKEIGHLGEIHPETLHAWNLKMPVTILEISMGEIFNQLKK